MPLIAVGSVKASPGVTTTCLALAAAWPAPRRLILEADPSGGDLGSWLGLPPVPGLAGLAAAARHDNDAGLAWLHAAGLPGGTAAVIAPAGADQAAACLTALTGTAAGFLDALAAGDDVVIADCGRLDPGSPAAAIAARAQVTLVMARPTVSGLSHLAMRAGPLAAAGARLQILLAPAAGRGPAEPQYPPAEICENLDLPVAGAIPADPRGAAGLITRGGAPRPGRRAGPLAAAAAGLAAVLAGPPPEPAAPAAVTAAAPARQPAGAVTRG